jgi:hypothetical protein
MHYESSLGEALIIAEGHLHHLGAEVYSPTAFVLERRNVTAGVPSARLREADVLPGLQLRSGSSIIDVVKVFPTNKEVVYRTQKGETVRMPTERFVRLAVQQGYRKVWDVKSFLKELKDLLKPVLSGPSIALIMKWVLDEVRGKKPTRERQEKLA